MGRKMKKLTRAGAGALAGVMIFGLAAPLAPLSVEAAGEIENLALNKTATASEQETEMRQNRSHVGRQILIRIRKRNG